MDQFDMIKDDQLVSKVIDDESTDTTKPTEQHVLPEGIEILRNQVAGHENSKKLFSMLKHGDTVLKVVTKPQVGKREIAFYEQLEKTTYPDLLELKQFVPKYHGIKMMPINGKQTTCIVLDDLTKDFKEPCIMDIKIGKRTWDPTASDEKIKNEEQKYVASKQAYGFCIPGFQVYSMCDNQLYKFDKGYGKKLDEQSVCDALRLFLNVDSIASKDLVMQFLTKLWRLQNWSRRQAVVHIYSSSLLLVYDAAQLKNIALLKSTSNDLDLVSQSIAQVWADIKMIDFAHVFPAENGTIDYNYLEGIESLVKLLESFLIETV